MKHTVKCVECLIKVQTAHANYGPGRADGDTHFKEVEKDKGKKTERKFKIKLFLQKKSKKINKKLSIRQVKAWHDSFYPLYHYLNHELIQREK